jgi:WD40 repeat protein
MNGMSEDRTLPHRRRKRRLSIPSALSVRAIVTGRPSHPPFSRFARRLFSAQPHAADDVASTLLSNQHSSLTDVVASSRLVDSIRLLDGKTSCSIVSPHVGAINSLDFDNHAEGRFLLAGSADGTISVYDVGPDGSEYCLDGGIENAPRADAAHRLRQMAQHRPLARSRREPPAAALRGPSVHPNYVPSGHGGSVSTVQWFNTDTGAFISADQSGQILIWDTNQFVPVSSMRLPGSIRCATMAKADVSGSGGGGGGTSHTLLAVGIANSPSGQDRSVRLCDLRSGSTSHELVGHGPRGGINAVVFSPVNDVYLCSGGDDAAIRLWDIRKSGSGACLAVLDREAMASGDNYSYTEGAGDGTPVTKGSKRHKLAPSDYSMAEQRHIQSAGGPISSLTVTNDGTTLVSTALDRRVIVWNVDPSTGRHCALPTSFIGPDQSSPNPIDANRRVAATIVQPGSRGTASLWLSSGCNLVSYGIYGPGGRPDVHLSGHLGVIRAIVAQENELRMYSGGADGMILAWGCPSTGGDDLALDYFARMRQQRRRGGERGSASGTKETGQQDMDCW